ncbi:MAG: hypothetical protein RLZZ621_2413 [Gemmatimonadota bacterium]
MNWTPDGRRGHVEVESRAGAVTVRAVLPLRSPRVDAGPAPSSFSIMVPTFRRSLANRLAPWGAVVLVACGGEAGQGMVELRGDVGGLDTLGVQGDSLLERTQRPAMLTDSGIVVAPAPQSAAATPNAPLAPTASPAPNTAVMDDNMPSRDAVAEAMTRRALAKSESLARLDARGGVDGANASSRSSASDTLRGELQVRVSEGTREFLLLSQGRRYVLSGVALRGALALNGLEVLVRGVAITPRDLAVSSLVVRGWQSLPVVDGVVTAEGTVRLTDGTGLSTRPIPPTLRPLVGARVWIAYRDGRPVQFDRLEQ